MDNVRRKTHILLPTNHAPAIIILGTGARGPYIHTGIVMSSRLTHPSSEGQLKWRQIILIMH